MPFQITDLFVSSLSSENREFLIARLTSLPLLLRAALYKLEDTTSYIYFRTSAIASVVKSMADGGTAELGLIGQEETNAGRIFCGLRFVSTHCFLQIEGTAVRSPNCEKYFDRYRARANHIATE